MSFQQLIKKCKKICGSCYETFTPTVVSSTVSLSSFLLPIFCHLHYCLEEKAWVSLTSCRMTSLAFSRLTFPFSSLVVQPFMVHLWAPSGKKWRSSPYREPCSNHLITSEAFVHKPICLFGTLLSTGLAQTCWTVSVSGVCWVMNNNVTLSYVRCDTTWPQKIWLIAMSRKGHFKNFCQSEV